MYVASVSQLGHASVTVNALSATSEERRCNTARNACSASRVGAPAKQRGAGEVEVPIALEQPPGTDQQRAQSPPTSVLLRAVAVGQRSGSESARG